MRLYPRNPRNSKRSRDPSICIAHRILDRLKAGGKPHQKISDAMIDWALKMTGDAPANRLESDGNG